MMHEQHPDPSHLCFTVKTWAPLLLPVMQIEMLPLSLAGGAQGLGLIVKSADMIHRDKSWGSFQRQWNWPSSNAEG